MERKTGGWVVSRGQRYQKLGMPLDETVNVK